MAHYLENLILRGEIEGKKDTEKTHKIYLASLSELIVEEGLGESAKKKKYLHSIKLKETALRRQDQAGTKDELSDQWSNR